MFKKKTLHNVVWEITLKCNAKCLHCGSQAGEARTDELNTQEALDVCNQLAQLGCRDLNLIGGELFLRPDWKEIISELTQNNVRVSIITNGIALTDEKIDFLAESGIKSVGISIDGGTPQTHDYIRQVPGLFDKIFKIAESVAKKGLNPIAVTTLNKLNILELPILREKLIESYFKGWQIQLAAPIGRMKQDLFLDWFEYYIAGLFLAQSRLTIPKEQLAIICLHDFGYYSKVIPEHTSYGKWTGCPAGKGVLGIRSDGKVQGCLSIYQDKFTEGDLRVQSLEEIWHSKKLCQWNNRLNRYFSLKGSCKKCEYALVCLGGCSDIAYSSNVELGENPQCYHAIELFLGKTVPNNEFERIFKLITQGHMEPSGDFYLSSGEKLSQDYVEYIDMPKDKKDILRLITK